MASGRSPVYYNLLCIANPKWKWRSEPNPKLKSNFCSFCSRIILVNKQVLSKCATSRGLGQAQVVIGLWNQILYWNCTSVLANRINLYTMQNINLIDMHCMIGKPYINLWCHRRSIRSELIKQASKFFYFNLIEIKEKYILH